MRAAALLLFIAGCGSSSSGGVSPPDAAEERPQFPATPPEDAASAGPDGGPGTASIDDAADDVVDELAADVVLEHDQGDAGDADPRACPPVDPNNPPLSLGCGCASAPAPGCGLPDAGCVWQRGASGPVECAAECWLAPGDGGC
jgi:hypothetical protein